MNEEKLSITVRGAERLEWLRGISEVTGLSWDDIVECMVEVELDACIRRKAALENAREWMREQIKRADGYYIESDDSGGHVAVEMLADDAATQFGISSERAQQLAEEVTA